MQYARFAGSLFLVIGILTILYAKQLAMWYEGPQYTMSDLGFVVYGMAFIGLSILCFIVSMLYRIRGAHADR